jgi:GTPase
MAAPETTAEHDTDATYLSGLQYEDLARELSTDHHQNNLEFLKKIENEVSARIAQLQELNASCAEVITNLEMKQYG